MPPPIFHVVLHEPEIPNNTGNIGRTCVATGCALHLIHPLGFDTSVKACRRAGLDYWPRLDLHEHESWEAFTAWSDEDGAIGADAGDVCWRPPRLWLFTTKGGKPPWEAELRRGDRLIFGKETRGLPDTILDGWDDSLLTLPMKPHERSLNVATAVCAAIYEGVRQCVQRNAGVLQ